MRTFRLSSFLFVPLLASLLASACSADVTTPSDPPPAQSLDVYSGPLDPGGLSTYLFTMGQTSSVELMLAGAVLEAPLRTISPSLLLRFSEWNGTECVPLLESTSEPRLTAALRGYFEEGTYCASVVDQGSLTEVTGVTLRIVAPALLRAGGEPGVDTFASTLTPGGTSLRTLRASTAGVVSLTLAEFSATGVGVGLGIGIPTTDFSQCKYSKIVSVLPGDTPQISVRVDAGDYCASVFDTAGLTKNETFRLNIAHP